MTKLHALSTLFMCAFKNTLASILQMRNAPEIGVMDRAKWEGDAVLMHIGPEPEAPRSCGKRMTVCFPTGIGSGTLAAATAATAAAAAGLRCIGRRRTCCRRCRF